MPVGVYKRKVPQVDDKEARRQRQALCWYDRYQAMLAAEGLGWSTTFDEFITLVRAQGALAVLAALNDRDDRLVTPSDIDRSRLAHLIARAERCIREHPATKGTP